MPSPRSSILLLFILVLAVGIVFSYMSPGEATPLTPAQRKEVEQVVRDRIGALSPQPPVLGGNFYVTDIAWEDDDTMLIDYEDGHIALKARADITVRGRDVEIGDFDMVDDDAASSVSSREAVSSEDTQTVSSRRQATASSRQSSRVSSSASSLGTSVRSSVGRTSSVRTSSRSSSSVTNTRPTAGEGEFCGGIAGIMCGEGLACKYDGNYPDAGGVCVESKY